MAEDVLRIIVQQLHIQLVQIGLFQRIPPRDRGSVGSGCARCDSKLTAAAEEDETLRLYLLSDIVQCRIW